MVKINQITKMADSFYKAAEDQYFSSEVKRIESFAIWGLASVKNLMAKPKYSKSPGLQLLQTKLPVLAGLCNQVTSQETMNFIQRAGELVGEMSFYTSRSNAGTGLDPVTLVKDGGYTPPAWYIDTINGILTNLKQRYSESPSDKPAYVA